MYDRLFRLGPLKWHTPYDLRLLKQLEVGAIHEWRRRSMFVALAGIAGAGALGSVVYPVWAVFYVAIMLAWRVFVKRLPDYADGRLLMTVLAAAIAYAGSFVSILCYSWARSEELVHYVALLGLFGGMLNTVTFRNEEYVLALSDFIVFSAAALWMAASYAWRAPQMGAVIFLMLLMGIVVIYFRASLRDGAEARSRLRTAIRTEGERDKLRALGQLTGGVAHDFNNLLTVIRGNLDLHSSAELHQDDKDELLNEVDLAAQKAAILTAQLLAFSRRSPLEPERVQVGDVVARAQVLLNRLLPATHDLVVETSSTSPDIEVDAGKLETVVVNLVMNARDACPKGGRITVSVFDRALPSGLRAEQEPNRVGGVLPAGRYVQLRVSDEGTGIAPELLEQILEPYFTTKPVGKGSGLGLPMAYGFAEQSGGTLTLTSTLGEGTHVSLWFPAVATRPVSIGE